VHFSTPNPVQQDNQLGTPRTSSFSTDSALSANVEISGVSGEWLGGYDITTISLLDVIVYHEYQ